MDEEDKKRATRARQIVKHLESIVHQRDVINIHFLALKNLLEEDLQPAYEVARIEELRVTQKVIERTDLQFLLSAWEGYLQARLEKH